MDARDGDRLVELVDVDADDLELLDRRRYVAGMSPRQEVVAADVHVRVLVDRALADLVLVDCRRADLGVVLHLAALSLVDRFGPLLDPVGHQARLPGRDGVHGRVHRQVVVVDLLAVILVVALLVGHAGAAHDQRGNRVAVLGDEEVVGVVVAVLGALVVERLLDAGTDHVLDQGEGEMRDLVQCRVLLGREEVARRLLVRVDEEETGVLGDRAHQGFVLRHLDGAAVAVRVEAPCGAADVVVTIVRSGDRLDEDVQLAQPPDVATVRARGQLVELLDGCLAAGGLVPVGSAGDPGEPGPAPDLRERR